MITAITGVIIGFFIIDFLFYAFSKHKPFEKIWGIPGVLIPGSGFYFYFRRSK